MGRKIGPGLFRKIAFQRSQKSIYIKLKTPTLSHTALTKQQQKTKQLYQKEVNEK